MAKKTLLLLLLLALVAGGYSDGGDRKKSLPEFTFLRLIYSGAGWATDYPKADLQFLYGLRELSDFGFIDSRHRALEITDPELFHYPFLYAVEVGYMRLSQKEVVQLREYLLRGGFLVVDDFHGPYEWQNFYHQIKKVLPEYEVFDLPPLILSSIVITILKSWFRSRGFSIFSAAGPGKREATGPVIWESKTKRGNSSS